MIFNLEGNAIVMQSDGNSYCGDVVLNIVMLLKVEDSIWDQIIKKLELFDWKKCI